MNFHMLCEGGLEAEGTATLLTLVRSFPVPTKPILLIHCVYTDTDSLSVPKNPILSIHCVHLYSICTNKTNIINTLCPRAHKPNIFNTLCLHYWYSFSQYQENQHYQFTVLTTHLYGLSLYPPKNQLYQQSILVSSHKHKTYKPICCSVSETLAMCTVFCLPFHVTVRWFHADNQ